MLCATMCTGSSPNAVSIRLASLPARNSIPAVGCTRVTSTRWPSDAKYRGISRKYQTSVYGPTPILVNPKRP
jgi:hypothetical protein